MKLNGKVALVTGAGRGIGAATAKMLAAEGASVLVNDRDEAPCQQVAEEIRAAGGRAIGFAVDITADQAAEQLIDQAMAGDVGYACHCAI